jgi:hypothetical protein
VEFAYIARQLVLGFEKRCHEIPSFELRETELKKRNYDLLEVGQEWAYRCGHGHEGE